MFDLLSMYFRVLLAAAIDATSNVANTPFRYLLLYAGYGSYSRQYLRYKEATFARGAFDISIGDIFEENLHFDL